MKLLQLLLQTPGSCFNPIDCNISGLKVSLKISTSSIDPKVCLITSKFNFLNSSRVLALSIFLLSSFIGLRYSLISCGIVASTASLIFFVKESVGAPSFKNGFEYQPVAAPPAPPIKAALLYKFRHYCSHCLHLLLPCLKFPFTLVPTQLIKVQMPETVATPRSYHTIPYHTIPQIITGFQPF